MENFTGIKELFDVSLRLNAPLEIGNKKYDINETILSFKTAEIAQINENIKTTSARGGYHNLPQVNWIIDQQMDFGITHGVLSPNSWALLSNSKIKEPVNKSVQYNEQLKVIEDKDWFYTDLKFMPNCCDDQLGAQPNPCFEPLPMGRRPELLLKPLPPSKKSWIFIYDIESGRRIRNFKIYRNRIFFEESIREVYIDYTFTYEDKIKVIEVGNRLLNGFLKLDGKMSVKDEKSGEITTAILELPKIKLSSSLTMKLGKSYDNSTVSDFYFTGYPDDTSRRREDQVIAKITFLDMELTGDYI